MKAYFAKTNAGTSIVFIHDNKWVDHSGNAKGELDGIDLYADNAEELFREWFNSEEGELDNGVFYELYGYDWGYIAYGEFNDELSEEDFLDEYEYYSEIFNNEK